MIKSDINSEAEIESRLIEVLCAGHSQWKYRGDLKSEADLWENLRQKISQNNLFELGDTPLTDTEFDRVKTELLLKCNSPFAAAKWLSGENGIARINIRRDNVKLGSISLILYSNRDKGGGISSYEVVNQIAKQGVDDNRDRRFDVTLLINGLPMIQIELKKSSAKDGVYQAFNQIKKYAEEGHFRNNIFSTLQLFVISNEQVTRYYANALPKDMHRKLVFGWRTRDNRKVDDVYEFSRQVLNIPDAHRLLADYTIISEDGDDKTLMVLHPYQIHAIEAIYAASMKRQSGYVWHATGSGKTLTSFVATKLLARKIGIDRTIMLIDRIDLDNQTTSEFTKFAAEYSTGISTGKGPSNSLIVGTKSAEKLSKELLSDSNSNTIIITTRQKLDAALWYAERQAKATGKERFNKLMGRHIVFIVDECHRALSAESMEAIKKKFPNSTWFGFTGTPIFSENKKQGKGKLPRTTFEQYGERLHTYTIKNALDDGAVLGFQVEHEDTVDPVTLSNYIFDQLRIQEKYSKLCDDEINDIIDGMTGEEKEKFLDGSIYENDFHIKEVIKKILKPDNAYIKFDFKNGRPQKSCILTTSSIEMAKRYYNMIKEMTKDTNWINELFGSNKLRQGRSIEDPDFPRVAITYSIQENEENGAFIQKEMNQIIHDYNQYYGTAWKVEDIARYNGDINNRLARKKAEFKQFGKQVDLVIVVDRLLTGFDAPTIQTLFVDRNLSYANLIQAFSRTNRTFPGKSKGLVVTFRKPLTMEYNVKIATKIYSEDKEDTGLIYPTYEVSKKRFLKAHKNLVKEFPNPQSISEYSPVDERVRFVNMFQELSNAFEAVSTYDEYNDEVEASKRLKTKIDTLEEYVGIYHTIKGSLISEISEGESAEDFSGIEFFGDNVSRAYDIDSAYVDSLLGNYSAGNEDLRNEIEKALLKLKKELLVRQVYMSILEAIDHGLVDKAEDIFSVKRRYFTSRREEVIVNFSHQWCVSLDELHTSAVQYILGTEPIPNLGNIIKSANFEEYKKLHPESKRLKFNPELKRKWRELLEKSILPLDDELR